MIFRRSGKHPPLLTFRHILIPIGGTEADEAALRLAALLLAGGEGTAQLLHVIEVPFERQLDAQEEPAVAFADEVLGSGEQLLSGQLVTVSSGVVQARAAGPAIVDDAIERGADLIVMGLRYKKRFGGGWDAGRTVPYVMRNSTAPVWCLRVETEEVAHTP